MKLSIRTTSSVVLLALGSGCGGDTWVVTGEVMDFDAVSTCGELDGVSDWSIAGTFDAVPAKPIRLRAETTSERAANAVVACVEDSGGTATATRA